MESLLGGDSQHYGILYNLSADASLRDHGTILMGG